MSSFGSYESESQHNASIIGKSFKNGQYEVIQKIGKGSFGSVYLVEDKLNKNERKAMKNILDNDLSTEESIETIEEVNILRRLKSPYIIQYFDCFRDYFMICIVTEYCTDGDLSNLIKYFKENKKTIKNENILKWSIEIMRGISSLHSLNIIHRDIKPGNIFLTDSSIKLGDLGLARVNESIKKVYTVVGTPNYTSPELILGEGYSFNSDVWSAGCVLYELIMLEKAFKGASQFLIIKAIVEFDVPQTNSPIFNDILNKMLKKDQNERCTSFEALKYFEQIKLDS